MSRSASELSCSNSPSKDEFRRELVLPEIDELHRADIHRFDDPLGAVAEEDVIHANPLM